MAKNMLESYAAKDVLESVPPTAPVLKRVNCIYVPATDPYQTIQWFGRYFGLHRKKPVKRDTNGESLMLGNGMELFILRAEQGSRMTFQTDVWAGPGFQMSMLSFEVTDDIVELHRSLREGGAHVEELRDEGGCGMGFWFYDPDGNKFGAWEMQTVVWRHSDEPQASSSDWKERFRFGNCYFTGDADAFLNEVLGDLRGSSRRIRIDHHKALTKSDPDGLRQLVGLLERFNREHPDRSFRIVYGD